MALFDSLIGNSQAKCFLSHALASGRVGQSWLFSGPEGIGKMAFAFAFASTLLEMADGKKEHPDLHLYRPEGKIGMHSMETMRQFQEEVHLAPYEAKRKVFILEEAERMLPSSSNTLLKTFEEPPEDCVILLVSSHPEHLLSTILSRCRQLRFQPLSEEELAKKEALFGKRSSDVDKDLLAPWIAKGMFSSYQQVKEAANAIGEALESYREELEKTAHKEIIIDKQELTALQKEALEKEIEGAVTLRFRQEVFRQLERFLGWYRDMIAIKNKIKPLYFTNQEGRLALEQAVQRGEIKPLETVQKAVMEARLSIERFIPLSLCFETLFLKTFLI